MKKLIVTIGIVITMLLMSTTAVLAQGSNRPSIIPAGTPKGETLLIPNSAGSSMPQEQYFGGVFLPNITQTVIAIAAGLAFLFMIIGGIQILTAYGNEEKVSAGRKTMTYAIVGLLVAILAYATVSIISAISLVPPNSSGQGGTQGSSSDGGLTDEQMQEKAAAQKQTAEQVKKGELAPGTEDL